MPVEVINVPAHPTSAILQLCSNHFDPVQEQQAILLLVGATLQQKKKLVSIVIESEQHCGESKGFADIAFWCYAGLQSAWWC